MVHVRVHMHVQREGLNAVLFLCRSAVAGLVKVGVTVTVWPGCSVEGKSLLLLIVHECSPSCCNYMWIVSSFHPNPVLLTP